MRPLKNKVVVEYLPTITTTKSGFHIPDKYARSQNPFTRAKVVSAGPKADSVKANDVVWIRGHLSGQPVEDKIYIVIETDIIAIEETE